MQSVEDILTLKHISFFIWNSNLPRHPVFYLATLLIGPRVPHGYLSQNIKTSSGDISMQVELGGFGYSNGNLASPSN